MTITRDAWGIPHVQGRTVLEVALEQGRATATDRAWQLEVERRRAEGTCAEVFGRAALEWDVLARRSLIVDVARRSYAALSAESRAFVTSYVDGVNEVARRPWQPWTPLAVLAVQHLLFGSFPSKLWRRHVEATAGPGSAEWLDLFRTEGLPGGSNAFAVAGSLTASGLPIVAGDPHRVLEAPGCYAQVRLVCTDPDDPFDVTGLTFVGVPGVQHFGHAGSVAWGITNAVADTEDVYDEELVRHAGAVIARGPAGWEPVARRTELVRVREVRQFLPRSAGVAPSRYDGFSDEYTAEEVEVLVTDRGPVILGGPDADHAVSLRTPPFVLGNLGLDAILPLLRARTAADVVAAYDDWVAPVNNLLVADNAGHVEHRVVGRVPARATGAPRRRNRRTSTEKPQHLVPAWVGDLPVRTGELLVSANDRATEDFSRIGDDFAQPFRADRIRELLDDLVERGPVTPEAAAGVLADVRQTAGAALLDTVAQLVDLDGPAADLRARLLAWDREMAADSVEAALFAAVRAAVVEGFAAAPVLAELDALDSSPYGDLFAPWFDLRGRIRLALPTLLAADKPLGVDPLQLVAAALEHVADAPEPGPWGERHVGVPLTPHEQFGLAPPDGSAAPRLPVGGDDDCVQATRALGGTGASVHGPVARFVWDLGGASRWVVPLGASGDPASPHHHDQAEVWAAGGTVPLARPSNPGEDR